MSKPPSAPAIRLRGVRHNNLKGFDLDLPLHRLIVVTGLSGSGKSSLAFDTLYAEGQRRYIETFSPYARQFFDRMDKPAVDSIEGIPPAIAIEQRNAVRTTRSTVGTMTEICDLMKVLWPQVAQLRCRGCGRPVRKEPPQLIWQALTAEDKAESGKRKAETASDVAVGHFGIGNRQSAIPEVLITFDLPLSEKLSLADSLALIAKQGYQRLLVGTEIVRLEDAEAAFRNQASGIRHLTVIQDRLRLAPANRARFVEACEQAYHFGKGKLTVFELGESALAMKPEVVKASSLSGESSAIPAPLDGQDARPTPHSALRNPRFFSSRLHCAACDIAYAEPSPALFSFNHPVGACPACKGFGRIIGIDYHLALPDRSLTLAAGAVRPWRSGFSAECQDDLRKFCRARGVPMNVPFRDLSPEHQRWVIEGDEGYGSDEEHQWPRAWYGVKGYFRWLETKAYKMHVRVLLSRYRAYTTCPQCGGQRLKPDALLYRLKVEPASRRLAPTASSSAAGNTAVAGGTPALLSLADFYALSIRDALAVIEQLTGNFAAKKNDPLRLVIEEVRARLSYLVEVGLGYLTLDRPTRTLSGGETERVNLTTCLGTRLVNTLYVLDEPSVGLHPRDTARLIGILEKLRDTGNTVVVVEHEASVMRAADQIVDLGPGHGESGGQVMFQGPFRELLKSRDSLTGQYLSGRKRIEIPARRPVQMTNDECRMTKEARNPKPEKAADAGSFRHSGFVIDSSFVIRPLSFPRLVVRHASRHNLRDLSVVIPLKRFVCLTGVSGSGKTTLAREILLPALQERLAAPAEMAKASDRADLETDENAEDHSALRTPHSALLTGAEHLRRVLLVDQSALGKTPRSNPAVYVGAFDDLREVFAQTEEARQRGLNASAFSFNSAQGQCERCRGAGFEKIEMQFLSDVFIRCPDCGGRRYRGHILEVKVAAQSPKSEVRGAKERKWSIADLLDATVDEALDFLAGFAGSKPAARGAAALQLLADVGLGYLRLGQPINTLSGGESQRLKLAAHLAESGAGVPPAMSPVRPESAGDEFDEGRRDASPTLFIFDEPTTGLHFEDVRVLLRVFQRLVDAGHSVLVIEHNLEVIKCADWVIDLGPEAGADGGRLVAAGTPEEVAACEASHTGRYLREVLRGKP